MRTAELYLEQTFIGALIMAIFAAPLYPDLLCYVESLKGTAAQSIAIGSIALGLAFWLGIPFDRFADTLSERLERHNRLRFGLQKFEGKFFPMRAADIFAEDEMIVAWRRDSGNVAAWMNYHRSRIRLARAMAVYGPALAVMLTLGALRIRGYPVPGRLAYWYGGVAGSYLMWAVLAQAGARLPRTNDINRVKAYARRLGLLNNKGRIKNSERSDLSIWQCEATMLAMPVLLLLAAILLGLQSENRQSVAVAWVATVMTVFCAWTWWRISFTYRSYLLDFRRFPPPPKPPAR